MSGRKGKAFGSGFAEGRMTTCQRMRSLGPQALERGEGGFKGEVPLTPPPDTGGERGWGEGGAVMSCVRGLS